MPSKLDEIRQAATEKSKSLSETAALYQLIKELKCLPDILGRDYEIFSPSGELMATIRQKPIKLNTLRTLFDEMRADYERQEREMKKSKGRGRR